MPRIGRLHITGGFYHVMGRGLERRHIFKETADKLDFLNRLGIALEATQAKCSAWALMGNHYHLLIQVGTIPLSQLMSKVLSGYATSYNLRHKRSGYVFQNRYKSILCDEETYFLTLIRYIHLNPIKAKVVANLSQLDRYRWTGHAGLLGKYVQDWQNFDEVLSRFSRRKDIARQQYREFLKEGLRSPQPDLDGGGLIRSYGGWQNVIHQSKTHEQRIGDERILGDAEFVLNSLKEDELAEEEQSRLKKQGWTLENLIKRICKAYEVDPKSITQKGRESNLSYAKALVCFWGTQKLGLSSTDIAVRLHISQPAVSKAVKRGRLIQLETKEELEDYL